MSPLLNNLATLLVLTSLAGHALGATAAPGAAGPGRHGLLVGVSGYPLLPPPDSPSPVKQLVAPATDVTQMTRVLGSVGFGRGDLTILADKVPGADALPTKARILTELDRLATHAAAGEYIVLYFSGHGSSHRASRDLEREVDRRDEIFLPLDVGRWEPDAGRVANALYDDEIWLRVERMLARGAFVWAIFDACNSATMVRGSAEAAEVARHVPESMLGVPPEMASAGLELVTRGGQLTPAPRAPSTAGLVAFYAAQETQTTPETLLPIQGAKRQQRGLFSFTLERAVARRPQASFAEIAQDIRYQYLAMGRTRPTPLFEGDLRRSVAGPAVSESNAAVQFMARREGDTLVVEAGELQGLAAGSALLLLSDPLQNNADALAVATVVSSDVTQSTLRLAPDAASECGVTRLATLATSASLPSTPLVARPCRPTLSPQLQLSRPELCATKGSAGRECIEPNPNADRQLFEGVRKQLASADIPGVRWVSKDSAERRLIVSGGRLWFAESSGDLQAEAGRPVASLPLSASGGVDLEDFATLARRMGSVTGLFKAAQESGALSSVKLVAAVVASEERRCADVLSGSNVPAPQEAESTWSIGQGQRLCVRVENPYPRPVDVTLLAVDSNWGITTIYPQPGQSNRLPARSDAPTGTTLDVRITKDDPSGKLHVILLALVPEQSDLQVVGFQHLAQAAIPTRGNAHRPEIGVLRLEVLPERKK